MAATAADRLRQARLGLSLLAAILPFFGDQPGTQGMWLLEIGVFAAIVLLLRLPAPSTPSPLVALGVALATWTAVCAAPTAGWVIDLARRAGGWEAVRSFLAPDPPDETYALRRALDAATACLLMIGVRRLAAAGPFWLARPARVFAAGAVAAAVWGLSLHAVGAARGVPPDWPSLGPIHLAGAHPSAWPRLSSLFGNPGWFGEYAGLCLPILLGAAVFAQGAARRRATIGAALLGAAVLLTWSRASWMSALVAGVLLA
jgi:hypothetical protein